MLNYYFLENVFDEASNIRYFLSENDTKTFYYTVDNIKEIINNCSILYDYNKLDNNLRQFIKISDFLIEKPDLTIFNDYKLFYFQYLEERTLIDMLGNIKVSDVYKIKLLLKIKY
jgi:hypothetical protein